MNDMENLKQLMNDYKQTTNTLFDMLDNYLEGSKKPTDENSAKKAEENTQE
ncbi:MAG: hypothetical protein ACI4ES_05945 [Roseburia sp.]